jgi:Glycosyltransferase family 87
VPVPPSVRLRLGARWQSFERWVGTRRSAAVLFLVALAAFALQSVVLPAYPGRDMSRYIQAFVQLFYEDPVLPSVINTRGPLSSLGVGIPLELGGWAAEAWLALLYAGSIVAWAALAYTFGARAAIATSALLLVYPGYAILFHELASDALFAAGFAGWSLLLRWAILRPSVRSFLALGAGMGLLVLVRPANQVLIVFVLLPLLLRGSWRERLSWAAAFFVPSAMLTQGWKLLNELRYGDAVGLEPSAAVLVTALVLLPFLLPLRGRRHVAGLAGLALACAAAVVVVGGWRPHNPVSYVQGAAQMPSGQVFFYRAFIEAKIVHPDNGPASRRLAEEVRRDLLAKEPYRSYGVDLDEFFSSGSNRVFGDMQGLSGVDRSAVTREAIREHPGTFVRGIGRTFWEQLWSARMYAPFVEASTSEGGDGGGAEEVIVSGRRLPRPTDGEPIPASRFGPNLWTLGGGAREVWRSPTDHSFVFDDPRDERRYEKFGRDSDRLVARIPTRDPNEDLVHRLNQASRGFPPPIVWLAVGVIGFALRRPRRALVAVTPAAAGLTVIFASSLLVFAVPQYAAPVTPAFVLLAAAGLFAPRREGAAVPGKTLVTSAKIAAGAAAVIAAAWAAREYVRAADYRLSVDEAPHDLAVFLRAASAVLDGNSPYSFRADETYAYPPLLAFLVSPFEALGVEPATVLWTLLSLTAIGTALWLLGVRDWRCYCLTALYPTTRSAVILGTVGPLLLLAVGVAWRWRDRLLAAGAAAGAAVALKLFLWPLAVWFGVLGRTRTALAAVGFALAFVFVPWAAIGLAGIGDYPDVLRRLADDEATASYSVEALGVRAHLPETAAAILSLLVTVGLLVLAALVARDRRRTPRDRDVAALTLCLAAALAASPIVWMHYFLLLLVPLALIRPRLSPLWLVPFAYWPLGLSAWPGGDAKPLGVALATTLVLIAAPLRRGAGDAVRPAVRRPLRLPVPERTLSSR